MQIALSVVFMMMFGFVNSPPMAFISEFVTFLLYWWGWMGCQVDPFFECGTPV